MCTQRLYDVHLQQQQQRQQEPTFYQGGICKYPLVSIKAALAGSPLESQGAFILCPG